MKVLVAQLCPTLCDPMDCSLPGSSVHGILQAKNIGVGFNFPSPRDLPKPRCPTLQTDSLPSEPTLSIILMYGGQEHSLLGQLDLEPNSARCCLHEQVI